MSCIHKLVCTTTLSMPCIHKKSKNLIIIYFDVHVYAPYISHVLCVNLISQLLLFSAFCIFLIKSNIWSFQHLSNDCTNLDKVKWASSCRWRFFSWWQKQEMLTFLLSNVYFFNSTLGTRLRNISSNSSQTYGTTYNYIPDISPFFFLMYSF